MPSHGAKRTTGQLRASLLATLLVLASLTLGTFTASAIGPNQTDLGLTGDLPDNSTSISSTSTFNVSGLAPLSPGVAYGELDVGDDEDWFAVQLNANEGLTVELNYNATYTSPNGSTYFNDFELWMFDSSMNTIDSSIAMNPEIVTTNGSSNPHGGMIYIQIYRYDGYGSYGMEMWTFNTSSSNGTGGGNGTTPPSNCAGSGTLTPDILEPNDSPSTATQASSLPLYCTDLSIDSSTDNDFYEVMLLTGVTYYVNVSFIGGNGDIDVGWDDASGSYIGSSTTTGSLESMTHTSFTNRTSYIDVYGYSGATNVYSIEISTDLPGGGQSFEVVSLSQTSLTSTTAEVDGLTSGTNYSLVYSATQSFMNGTSSTSSSNIMNFTANGTMYNTTLTVPAPVMIESNYCVEATLSDASGTLSFDLECSVIEMLQSTVLSSTTGSHSATNLTVNTDYTLWWFVLNDVQFQNSMASSNDLWLALNASVVDQEYVNFTSTSSTESWLINWSGITTMDEHILVGILYYQYATINLTTSEGFLGVHDDSFIPQLPSLVLDSYSSSSAAATNNVNAKGSDLVTGDSYKYIIQITDTAGAIIASNPLSNFTATAQNMSMPTFSYSTPNMSGVYCAEVLLYSSASVQLIGDSGCFQLIIDDDNDGVANENDLCPNSATTMVDQNGCELSQKDTDGDGYNDDVDDFPNDSTQYSDMDGDGYGDNPSGNAPDAFPTDASQWSDYDGDGYGDNLNGNNSDAFPYDASQWSDNDGDGYGDNASGNYPDAYPADSTQWADDDGDSYGDNPNGTNGDKFPTDSSQWSDQDGDGYGDNPNGNSPDAFPNDSTQWADQDGDGYGDNPNGNNGDAFPSDSTQWSDMDADGYGDNQAGNQPDAFPMDGTQWSDQDGDGYGDNQNGNNADRFPTEPSQWSDEDGDGYGDNANGDAPDQCLETSPGEVVDSTGCSEQQKDDDLDGIPNSSDACPMTPAGEPVDTAGCSGSQEDADNDGVMDMFDACPLTPLGSEIDAAGCADTQRDTDNDEVNDQLDECPLTAPEVPVNGVGCSSAQRDTDGDDVNDMMDTCPMTMVDAEVDENGCSDAQKDDDSDAINNDVDQCPDTTLGFITNADGCAEYQQDDDGDMIDNTIDICDATPSGQQVDAVGCAASQLDQDNDSIKDDKDLCPDTDESENVNLDGCSPYQIDDDSDGIFNIDDTCPRTPESSIVFDDGCALTQMDTDKDGVNDAEDDFPLDPNETLDSDGDGIADTYDAFPNDPTKSEQASDSGGSGLTYAILALLVACGLGALLVVRRNQQLPENNSPFAEETYQDYATEAYMGSESEKELPAIAHETQEWEENGVNWSKSADGSLYYYDNATENWVLYQPE